MFFHSIPYNFQADKELKAKCTKYSQCNQYANSLSGAISKTNHFIIIIINIRALSKHFVIDLLFSIELKSYISPGGKLKVIASLVSSPNFK